MTEVLLRSCHACRVDPLIHQVHLQLLRSTNAMFVCKFLELLTIAIFIGGFSLVFLYNSAMFCI